MERLDDLSSGVREQNMGKDKDCPPFASSATTDHMASMLDVPQTLFDALR